MRACATVPKGSAPTELRQLLALISRLRQRLPQLQSTVQGESLAGALRHLRTAIDALQADLRRIWIMTPLEIRQSVRTLQAQGHSLREIGRLLRLSRNTVRRILRATPPVPAAPCPPADAGAGCKPPSNGHAATSYGCSSCSPMSTDLNVAYSTLTRWVRQAGLRTPPQRAGEYNFAPGEEMQHDTSPHRVSIGGQARHRPVRRPGAGVFAPAVRALLSALHPLRGQALPARGGPLHGRHCAALRHRQYQRDARRRRRRGRRHRPGDGRLRPHPGLQLRAHRVGHPDRKGRIERPFAWVETNFLPGRSFRDFEDLNRQALMWCSEIANHKPKRVLGMSPEAAYVIEKPYLQPLPAALPPVYEVLERVVDLYGYVSVDTNRYSVPERFVGQSVTVYKYPAAIHIHHRGVQIATHPRLIGQRDARQTEPAHHPTPARANRTPGVEAQLLRHHPELEAYARR